MKPIVVKDQVHLGAARCFGLAISSMSYRFFRSAVTVSVLALAVAFLAHMLSYGVISHQTTLAAYNELKGKTAYGEWVRRLTAPDLEGTIIQNLARGRTDRLAEYQAWSGAAETDWSAAQETARRIEAVYAYFQDLPPAAQAILTANLDPPAALQRLSAPGQFDAFASHLAELKIEPPLSSLDALRRLVDADRPMVLALVQRVQAGQRAAIGRIRDAFGSRPPRDYLAEASPQLAGVLEREGFRIDRGTLDHISVMARDDEDLARLTAALDVPAVKMAVGQVLGLERAAVNVSRVLEQMTSSKRAAWLAGLLAEQPGGAGRLDGARIRSLAEEAARETRLAKVVGDDVPEERQGLLAVPAWMQWLIGLSFLVCTVGVANAMTMAVTERFSEIATMKCLGAMDGVVMLLFLFESGLQGLIGAAAGLAVGIGLAAVRALAGYGSLVVMPWADILLAAGICLAAGLFLSVVGAVGPAWMAARLAPMEAMRIE